MRGFLKGRGLDVPLLHAEEEGFACEPLAEKFREFLHPGSETVHLLIPMKTLERVKEAVAQSASQGHAMAIREERPVSGARFGFYLHVFSREHGASVRKLLTDLPAGARPAPETHWEETEDPSAKGDELYAPAHEYELKGEGGVEGDLLAVLEVYRKCREEELIRVEKAQFLR